jgi:hypothetical protein
MSKWAMRAHFRHVSFNSFATIWKTLWDNEFWSLQSHFEHSGVLLGLQLLTWEFISECEGSFPHTFCTPRSMWSDSRVSLLACNLVTPCLGCKPKVTVVTMGHNLQMLSQHIPCTPRMKSTTLLAPSRCLYRHGGQWAHKRCNYYRCGFEPTLFSHTKVNNQSQTFQVHSLTQHLSTW